jgi:hypothetical protein
MSQRSGDLRREHTQTSSSSSVFFMARSIMGRAKEKVTHCQRFTRSSGEVFTLLGFCTEA